MAIPIDPVYLYISLEPDEACGCSRRRILLEVPFFLVHPDLSSAPVSSLSESCMSTTRRRTRLNMPMRGIKHALGHKVCLLPCSWPRCNSDETLVRPFARCPLLRQPAEVPVRVRVLLLRLLSTSCAQGILASPTCFLKHAARGHCECWIVRVLLCS